MRVVVWPRQTQCGSCFPRVRNEQPAGQSLSTACTGTPAPHTAHLTVSMYTTQHTAHLTVSTYTTQLVNRCQLLVLALLHHTVSQTARLIITLLLLLQSMQLRRYSIIFGFVESIRDARV